MFCGHQTTKARWHENPSEQDRKKTCGDTSEIRRSTYGLRGSSHPSPPVPAGRADGVFCGHQTTKSQWHDDPSEQDRRKTSGDTHIYILYLDSWQVSYVKSCPKSESISTIFYHFLPELYPFLLFIPHSCWAEPSSCTTSASVECPLWSLRPLVAARPLAVAPFLGSVKTLELPGLFLLFVFSLVYELTLFFGIVLFGFALVMQIRVPIRI